MVNEVHFTNNDSQWLAFKQDKCTYLEWLQATIAAPQEERTHGFRYRGQYQEQVPQALEIARKS